MLDVRNMATEFFAMLDIWLPQERRGLTSARSESRTDSGSLKYARTNEPAERTLAIKQGRR